MWCAGPGLAKIEGLSALAMSATSRLPQFYSLSPEERLHRLAEAAGVPAGELEPLRAGLTLAVADRMVENVVGVTGLPLGIATNFVINGREVLVPMAIEEASVVAGASKAARAARSGGGFVAECDPSLMIGQVQLLGLRDVEAAAYRVLERKAEVLNLANSRPSQIVELGGGATDLEARVVRESPAGPMLVVHLIYDVRDAMGANAVNSTVELVAPLLEAVTGGRANLRVISNLADRRLARARVKIVPGELDCGEVAGSTVAARIVEAYSLAAVDPYRAATHNKGIMNGVDAVAVATGNDWRALEAGAHAYAARQGRYGPLSQWAIGADGQLEGCLEMPMPVGTVGGATRACPTARACLRLMGVETASALAEVMAAVGLAQNLAALWALVTEGIQRGHMALHARQVALAAGAAGAEVEAVAGRMIEQGEIRSATAERLVREMRGNTQETQT
ncbi:MAG: hydroxymethylglutaryl-CoA reductase, degradative [Anaerolineae bacterium]|nr:hydroxymethylglutaryl-CoA reductase, degradative [Anaerolineae bacterium]